MISRRQAIGSAVGLTAVAALTACTPEVTSLTESSAEPTAAPKADGVEVCKVSDVPVGSGKRFTVSDTPILITQPKAGDFRGFSAVCTHAGFVMSTVVNSEIICDNHGAVYSAEDGSVQKGPAQRALGKITVTVEGDSVLVSF